MKNLLTLIIAMAMSTMLIAQPCSGLFISEYVEGSGNNKALEIFNASGSAINLSGYKVILNFSNSGGTDEFALPGVSLADGDVYVLANDGASLAGIINAADTLLGFPSVTTFTGDDMVALLNSSNDTIDKIGLFGEDGPGSNGGWTVGGEIDATSNHTLQRNASVQEGTNNWILSSSQWTVLNEDDVSGLGSHTMTACGTAIDTVARFVTTQEFYDEGDGTVAVNLVLSLGSFTGSYSVDVALKSGDVNQLDGGFTTQTVTFTGSNPIASFNVTIADDTDQEGATTLEFVIRPNAASPTVIIGADSLFNFVINPSDQLYTIAQVRGNNIDGIPDSNGISCVLHGVVYNANNLNQSNSGPSGLRFFIHDGTGGIEVYAPSSVGNLGYTVTEGDSIAVSGEITDNRGQSRIGFLTNITLLGSGKTIPDPTPVNGPLNESTEGELLILEDAEVINESGSTNKTYEVEVGTETYIVFVDADAGVTQNINIGETYTFIGMGGQFSDQNSPPFTEGYQLIPRKASDVSGGSGITELSKTEVTVYPNPVEHTVFLNTKVAGLSNVSVFDITGRLVVSETIESTTTKLDVNGLQPGVYMLQATGNNQVFNSRIVKQ